VRNSGNTLSPSSLAGPSAADSAPVSSASVAKRAAYVIANGSISLDAKQGIFTVHGTVETRLVQLVPKLSCSCPETGGCYHIAAAKQAIGMRDDVQRRKLNLTQLHKNKRNRPDKTSGRKRPRTADVDVIATPTHFRQ